MESVITSYSIHYTKLYEAGDVWEIGKGYSLTVNQVDVEGNKVWFSLSKDGEELESGIVYADSYNFV